jgi:hypothetical protein
LKVLCDAQATKRKAQEALFRQPEVFQASHGHGSRKDRSFPVITGAWACAKTLKLDASTPKSG